MTTTRVRSLVLSFSVGARLPAAIVALSFLAACGSSPLETSDAGPITAPDAGLPDDAGEIPDAGSIDNPDAGPACTPADCDDHDPCTTDTCTATGCEHAPASGATCNDNDGCTTVDLCVDGSCVGSEPVTCAAPGRCEKPGACEPSTGECTRPRAEPGTACDDGDLTTSDDACDASGLCVGHAIVCPADTTCATWTPNGTGTCVPTFLQGACDDGSACTTVDRCEEGVCVGSDPVVCATPGACEEQGACDPGTGLCVYPLSVPGTACNDGDLATYSDACDAVGHCGGLAVICPDDDVCVSYAPDGTATCTPTLFDGISCNDGNACTQTDRCDQGFCEGENPVACADPTSCDLPGTCAPETGACTYPHRPAETTCDDGNTATYEDRCDGSGTCAGAAVTCPPDDACTAWTPNGTGTCVATIHSGATCNDSDECTPAGTCNAAGACVVGAPVSCENGGACLGGGCVCPMAWKGPNCTVDVDECALNACGGASTCTNTPGSFSCACIQNYTSADGSNCVNSVPALELAVFYDERAMRMLGNDPETKIVDIVHRAKTLLDNSLSAPPLTISLNALGRLDPFPAAIQRRACNTSPPSRPDCTGCYLNMFSVPPDCTGVLSTSALETDVDLMLGSFSTYTRITRRAAVESLSGGIDVGVLVTGSDLTDTIIGLASIASACTNSGSAVVQVSRTWSPQLHALLLAHELGHTLNMQHDQPGTPCIMAPSMGPGAETITQFSATSLSSYRNWVTALGTGSRNCFQDPAKDDWFLRTCGNGVVDPDEQCDPGIAADSCCTSTCQLAPGCACANTEPCCANGALRAAGTVCRASENAICDVADTCDGVTSGCVDTFAAAGTPCTSGGFSGLCFGKACASREEQCRRVSSTHGYWQNPLPACSSSTRCDRLDCLANCSTWFPNAWPEDGSPCGTGRYCLAGTCVLATQMHVYAWAAGPWSACVNRTASRTTRCVDESGGTVETSFCDPETEPAVTRSCTM